MSLQRRTLNAPSLGLVLHFVCSDYCVNPVFFVYLEYIGHKNYNVNIKPWERRLYALLQKYPRFLSLREKIFSGGDFRSLKVPLSLSNSLARLFSARKNTCACTFPKPPQIASKPINTLRFENHTLLNDKLKNSKLCPLIQPLSCPRESASGPASFIEENF